MSGAGLAERLGVRLVSGGTSVRIRFGFPFSSKVVAGTVVACSLEVREET